MKMISGLCFIGLDVGCDI